jgi:hypothetical protein
MQQTNDRMHMHDRLAFTGVRAVDSIPGKVLKYTGHLDIVFLGAL